VLQVHDEILVESVLSEAEEVRDLTESVMKSACELAVPLAVHVAHGRSWADAKDVAGAAGAEEGEELDFDLDPVGA